MMLALGSDRNRARRLLEGYSSGTPLSEEADWISPGWFEHELRYAGYTRAQRKRICIRISIAVVVSLLVSLSLANALPLGIASVWIAGELLVIRSRARSRSDRFEQDYVAFLLSLASAVRTGLDPLQALTRSALSFPKESLITEEIGKLQRNFERGLTEEEAIRRFAESVRHPDLPLFRCAFLLARREGSSLSQSLQRLARVTRARQSFRRRAKAAVAMQRLSAYGIVICSVVIGVFQVVTNREAVLIALEIPMGRNLLLLSFLLLMIGLVWVASIARVRT